MVIYELIFTDNDVAFKLTVGSYNSSTDKRVKFGAVLLNKGHGYNMSTGLFTVPVPGLYTFTAQICSNQYTGLYISTNSYTIAYSPVYISNIGTCTTTTGVAILYTGDAVGVFISGTDNVPRDSSNQYTGYIIHRYG